jgi:uncharacterized protein DUF2877
VPTALVPCAASFLLAPVLGRDQPIELTELLRTPVSVHYETGHSDVPLLCVITPQAVRLPNAVVCDHLPGPRLTTYDGTLRDARRTWRVQRWWTPRRPHGLRTPGHEGQEADLRPVELVGRGPGLTPAGDDLLCGALVAAHAVADPRLPRWRRETRAALAHRQTTAVSRALLLHALDGWAVPQLADFVEAVCRGVDVQAARARLHEVGHSSGASLAEGALRVLAPSQLVSAA